jgi:hypothetical protein
MNESATTGSRQRVPIVTRSDWQMPLGDRAVLEGVLTQIKPSLSVEIGTAQGGSLERIAAHSDEVHALDLSDELLFECPPNAEFHMGDSARILPELLAGFASEGRNIDFALVDGDHSPAGVKSDLDALLASRAAPVVAHRGAPSVKQLERELESMRSSWSWRITAPLRALKARLRRLTRA